MKESTTLSCCSNFGWNWIKVDSRSNQIKSLL